MNPRVFRLNAEYFLGLNRQRAGLQACRIGACSRTGAGPFSLSGEDVLDDVAGHAGQPHVQPLELHGKPFVVHAEQVEHRRVEIVDADRIFRAA